MKHLPIVWANEDTENLVKELLDNKDYFSDVENDYQENGLFDVRGLSSLVSELGTIWMVETINLSLVDWVQAANVVNLNMDIVPNVWKRN